MTPETRKGRRCNAKYGPHRCKRLRGHKDFAHRDGKVLWAPNQRWRRTHAE